MPIPTEWPQHVQRRASSFLSLYKYYRVSRTLSEVAVPFMRLTGAKTSPSRDEHLRASALLSYWFASLYVLSEAWDELGLRNPLIDNLLTSEHVHALRRYRNAVFHYQHDLGDSRITDFVQDGPVQLAMNLGEAYQEFFDRHNEAIDVEAIRSWLFAPAVPPTQD